MKFGLFDHIDRSDLALAEIYDRRLDFIEAADRAGLYGYHVAEHHATPLNMVPVPGVFLGAAARATKSIRLGPLVYLLPLYSPLRLIEEVAMLDHLSHGRLEFGVGRGVSPFELNYHKVDPETSREVFLEALDAVLHGLTHDRLDHVGKHFQYRDVPMELRPLQQPHPPVWYPSSSAPSAGFSGAQGYNFSTLGATTEARAVLDSYREGYARRGRPHGPALPFPGGTAIGINRHVVIAETDAEAKRIAAPAYERWYSSLTKIWRENQVARPTIASSALADVGEAMKAGSFIVGSPETVADEMSRQIEILGVNYFICGLYFGTLAHEHAMRSLSLLTEQVIPRVAREAAAAK